MPKAYLAPSLVRLRNEINTTHPNRDKASDGWLGDAAHAARKSDHNPDYEDERPGENDDGVVRATDTDKDGIDANRLVQVAIRDNRVNYVIFNRFIYSRAYNFAKRAYTGASPHTGHVHISIRHGKIWEDDMRPWGYSKPVNVPVPTPTPPEEEEMQITQFGRIKGRPADFKNSDPNPELVVNGLINENAVFQLVGKKLLHVDEMGADAFDLVLKDIPVFTFRSHRFAEVPIVQQ